MKPRYKLLEKGLEKTMREYGNHLNYKIFIDRLQATYSCCGAVQVFFSHELLFQILVYK